MIPNNDNNGGRERRTLWIVLLLNAAIAAGFFISGFFASGLEHSAVDMDYYVYMGGGAYYSLSSNTRGTLRGRALNAVFAELSAKFQDMVDVLNEVRESARASTDSNLMRIYELWLKTGSQRSARQLRDAGVYPMPIARTNFEH